MSSRCCLLGLAPMRISTNAFVYRRFQRKLQRVKLSPSTRTTSVKKKAEVNLADLVFTNSGVKLCKYPANAIQDCTRKHLCAYTCASGTTRCSNGKCLKTCPSAAVVRREQLPMATSASRCPANQEMCRFGYSYKCVDTQNSLVSCGGCMHGKPSKRGQDCSEIPGVDAVSCNRGVCDVKSCTKDYTFDPDYRNCSLTANVLS